MNRQARADDDAEVCCGREMSVQSKVWRERFAEEDDVWFHEAVAGGTVWDRSRGDGGMHRLGGECIVAVYAAVSGEGFKREGWERQDVSCRF